MITTCAELSCISIPDEQQRGRFKQLLHAPDELGGLIAIDNAMVERGRQVHHHAWNELTVPPYRADRHPVDADDRELRPVDDRRRCDAAELAETRDGDGRAAQLFPLRTALPRRIGKPLDLRRASPEVERF